MSYALFMDEDIEAQRKGMKVLSQDVLNQCKVSKMKRFLWTPGMLNQAHRLPPPAPHHTVNVVTNTF